jgi:hypothetical protein
MQAGAAGDDDDLGKLVRVQAERLLGVASRHDDGESVGMEPVLFPEGADHGRSGLVGEVVPILLEIGVKIQESYPRNLLNSSMRRESRGRHVPGAVRTGPPTRTKTVRAADPALT